MAISEEAAPQPPQEIDIRPRAAGAWSLDTSYIKKEKNFSPHKETIVLLYRDEILFMVPP